MVRTSGLMEHSAQIRGWWSRLGLIRPVISNKQWNSERDYNLFNVKPP